MRVSPHIGGGVFLLPFSQFIKQQLRVPECSSTSRCFTDGNPHLVKLARRLVLSRCWKVVTCASDMEPTAVFSSPHPSVDGFSGGEVAVVVCYSRAYLPVCLLPGTAGVFRHVTVLRRRRSALFVLCTPFFSLGESHIEIDSVEEVGWGKPALTEPWERRTAVT